MEEILMELKILKKIIEDSQLSLHFRLDNDEDFDKDISFLKEEVTFGRVLSALTRNLTQEDMLKISNTEMLKHIQKIQVIEKD